MLEFVWPVVDWPWRFRHCAFSYYFEGPSKNAERHPLERQRSTAQGAPCAKPQCTNWLVLHLCWHLIADRRSALFSDRCSDLPPFDAVDNWGLTPPCRYKKRTPSVHSRGLQLALFEALLSRRLRGCWGDGGKSPEGPTCASHFANPATAIRDGQHILEHCEPLPEIDDPVTLVTLTVAKMVATLHRWIEGVLP